jgi:hypothetical protein
VYRVLDPVASRLDTFVHLASGGWEAAAIWTPLLGLSRLALTSLLVVLTWRLLPKQQRLFYSVFETPMLTGIGSFARTEPKVKVLVDDAEIAAPRVVTVRLVLRAAHDLPESAFDGGKPLVIDFGSRVVATEAVIGNRPEWADAKTIANSAVHIRPMMLRKSEILQFAAIIDGPVHLKVTNPLLDVQDRQRDWSWDPAPWWRSREKRRLILISAVLLASGLCGSLLAAH